MKISKLFHCLYAFIMFIPVFAIFISCGYVMFNKNAFESYYGHTINESNFVDIQPNNLVSGNTYFIETNTNYYDSSRIYIYCSNIIDTRYNTEIVADSIQISGGSNSTYLAFYNGNNYVSAFQTNLTQTYLIQFDFESIRLDNTFPFQFKQIEYNKYSYLDNVFYYAIDNLKSSSLFNWAKSSFLAQPITYITDLFGMDSDNLVIYLLSYWLDISIIWLTFDVVMYVPLLVHRWLDKGVLE